MSATHLGPRCLPVQLTDGEDDPWKYLSRFCWAMKPEGKLVIFVHGFGGDALTTWEQFVSLWPEKHAGWDLAFFGYPSLAFNVEEHTISFLNFLNLVLASPADTVNRTIKELFAYRSNLRREPNFGFSRIVLVAHSMGAVICRRALIQHKDSPWVSNTKIILFAPAHKGAKPLMFFEALTAINWGSAFGAGLKFFIPPLKDLKEGSDVLLKLEEKITHIVLGGRKEPFVASRVVHAMPDWIVHNALFASDPDPEQVFKTTHRKVCKPQLDWERPLKNVIPYL
jgi:pimeloyl-ACP methyl ester carboxylesterase